MMYRETPVYRETPIGTIRISTHSSVGPPRLGGHLVHIGDPTRLRRPEIFRRQSGSIPLKNSRVMRLLYRWMLCRRGRGRE